MRLPVPRYLVSGSLHFLRLKVSSPVAHPHEEPAADDVSDGDREKISPEESSPVKYHRVRSCRERDVLPSVER